MNVTERNTDRIREYNTACVFKKHDVVRISETAAEGLSGEVAFFCGINGDGTAHVIHPYKGSYDVPVDILQPLSRA